MKSANVQEIREDCVQATYSQSKIAESAECADFDECEFVVTQVPASNQGKTKFKSQSSSNVGTNRYCRLPSPAKDPFTREVIKLEDMRLKMAKMSC